MGEDHQFSGKVYSYLLENGKLEFRDKYSGTGGWNPVSEEMAMEVLGLNAARRWKSQYLKHIKKTKEDLRGEWHTDAEKRSKVQMVLNKIAVLEDLHADKDKLDKEVKALMEHYKDASEDRARDYVESILTNEKVFEFLENTAK